MTEAYGGAIAPSMGAATLIITYENSEHRIEAMRYPKQFHYYRCL